MILCVCPNQLKNRIQSSSTFPTNAASLKRYIDFLKDLTSRKGKFLVISMHVTQNRIISNGCKAWTAQRYSL